MKSIVFRMSRGAGHSPTTSETSRQSRWIMVLMMVLTSLTFSDDVMAQKERQAVRQGNKEYQSQDYVSAKEKYAKAIELDPSYGKARYNLGNAEYRMQSLEAAAEQFEMAAADAIDKKAKADALHNEANCYLAAAEPIIKAAMSGNEEANEKAQDAIKMLRKSIETYKEALRNDPSSTESRYNLMYAKQLLPPPSENQDQQEQQEENEEQEQEEQEQEEQEESEQENEDGEEGEEEQENNEEPGEGEEDTPQEQPEQSEEMTKEEAERLLEAVDKMEEDLQDREGLERVKGKKIEIDKDW